ncbi:hypothetical protein RJ640_008860 [Escallonia rubra]|uniref:Dirigent protein n=1 Tax=Escallonia rubra TaxID=112253 RepID=A0AA88QMC4_9ASTE|nr:hypothetical protein RJ640_008860 [Escallonia rubra]
MSVVLGVDESPKAVEQWFQKLSHRKEKLTKLHFYFHDIVSGKNPNAIHVAGPSQHHFYITHLVRPEPDSEIVGRAQGIYGSAGLEDLGLLMTLNFVFIEGKYNESTLSVLGRNPVFHKYHQMPIVSGSGVFRVARGVATAKTIWFNLTTGDAVAEYQVMVLTFTTFTIESCGILCSEEMDLEEERDEGAAT